MENLTPITRKETFLAKAAGQDVETPTPVTREEVFLDAIAKGGGGGSSNLFLVTMLTSTTADKTYDETVAALEAGKTVMVLRNERYYSFLERSSSSLYFVGNEAGSTSLSFGKLDVIQFQKTTIGSASGFKFLNNPVAADNGSELIVKNGNWAMQQKKFVVTLTPTALDYSGTMDKTVAEINTAYEAGQEIVFRVMQSATAYMDVDCTARWNDGSTYPSFNGFIVMGSDNVLLYAYTGETDDGTRQTYNTKVYALTPAS